jgi:membrane fusion protein, heavy metal efflux system
LVITNWAVKSSDQTIISLKVIFKLALSPMLAKRIKTNFGKIDMNKKIKLIAITSLFCGLASLSTASTAIAQSSNQTAEQGKEHPHENSKHNEKEKHLDEHPKKDDHGHDDDHKEKDEHGHGGEEEEGAGVTLSNTQLDLAEIQITKLEPQPMAYDIYAPGEIKANDYTGYLVSPRVDSVIIKRHVGLGDHVEKNQPLVTLFSESVAEAQANYRIASAEWRRVKQLGRKAVGDKRYIEAQTDFEADYGRLEAFGLSNNAIQSLTKKSKKLGQYTLNALIAGAVLSDNFRQGQRVESGDTLIELADEHTLWVDALLAPTMQLSIPVGSKAQIVVGENTYFATVSQKAHTIDPQTRTRIVRLQVENEDHQLHPGLFADVYFAFETTKQILAVPEAALMRGSDGDWMVFVEENGEFKGQEIELGRTFGTKNGAKKGKWREVRGIAVGTKVVTKGAFYVAAEIAKGGFDAHNH